MSLAPTGRAIRREMRRKYGQPCRGFWSSHSKDQVAPEVLTGDSTADSYNVLVSSQENHIVRRRGIAYYGESDVTAQAGLLEAVTKNMAMNMTCRHMLDVQYPSATPGSIVGPTALYTDQLDTGHFGQIYALTSTQGTRKVLGHEMGTLASPGTTHYPRTVASSRPNFRMIPLPYMAGGSGTQAVAYGRATFPLQRALMCGGSMKMTQSDENVFWSGLHATPGRWNRKSNPSTSTGSEQVLIGPWGLLPPMFMNALGTGDGAASTADQVWWDGDAFYMSCVHEMEDGSFSAPFQIRPINAYLTAGRGLIVVGTSNPTTAVTTAAAYKNVNVTVPLGPPGTKNRLVCRTRKTNVSTATTRPAGMTPQGALSDLTDEKLYVCGIINDNASELAFRLESSLDDQLLDDAIAINAFVQWPLPGRYTFTMERRLGVGYTRRQNPCAFIVGDANDYNRLEDGTSPGGYAISSGGAYGTIARAVRIYQDTAGAQTLYLRATNIGTATIETKTLSAVTSLTLQNVIDWINSQSGAFGTVVATPCAAPVPGTEPNRNAILAPSVLDVASCTLGASSDTVTSSAKFADVAIGMRVKKQSGTGTVNASAVVIAKASDSSITIGTENGAALGDATAGTATLRFWSDTGDDGWSSDTATWDVGNMRVYSDKFVVVIALKGSLLDGLGYDKLGLQYTSAPPGGASLAGQNFVNKLGTRHRAPLDAGVFMGSAPVFGANLVAYSEQLFVLTNTKQTNTGEDQDYHLAPLTPKGLGCIQYGTVAYGTGWAGCLTNQGYLVTDGRQYQIISNPLLDPARRTGILAYQGVTLASFNGSADLPQYQTAHALVVDGTLRLSVQPNAAIA